MKYISRVIYFTLVLIYIFFEELLWNNIAQPIIHYIAKLNLYKKFLNYIEHSANKYIILALFTIPFIASELLGFLSMYLFASGKIILSAIIYILKIPAIIVALGILNAGKIKLETIAIFKICFDFAMLLIDKLHNTAIYKTVKISIVKIKIKLTSHKSKTFRFFVKIYNLIKRNDMTLNTHLKLNPEINGEVIELKQGYAKVKQQTKEFMVADDMGLVHGGFAFCAADFTAMAAINDPFVVLGKSETKFIAPVKLGECVIFEGKVVSNDGAKSSVEVIGCVNEKEVFKGTFTTFTLEKHILSDK